MSDLTTTAGATPKAKIRNYITSAFPAAKTIKVREYFRNGYKVRLRFNDNGRKSTVYGIIYAYDLLTLNRLRDTLRAKMETYCLPQ